VNSADRVRAWIDDPVLFVREVFVDTPPVEPDEWQKDVLRAFPTHQRIGMKSCKGPGKTTLLSWIIWNFMSTRPNPKVAVTSITSDNLTDNLWSELAKWYGKSEFLQATFDLGKTRITAKENPMEWYCSAKTWSKDADQTQQSLTLAGFHSEYVLFVLDEVGGIPDAVMASAEAALSTGTEMKIVMAGNPTHLEGPLWKACNEEADLWHMTEITGDPDDPKRSPRVSEQWAQEQIDKYGRDNPWVIVNVFGKFPPASMNALLGPDDVSKAMSRHLRDDEYNFSQKRLGIDVARYGDDSTVIFPRQGLAAFHPVELKGQDSHAIAGRVATSKASWGSELETIDSTGGFSAGVEDALKLAGTDMIPIHFAGKALDARYFNRRSEMWYEMSLWVKKGGALPPDPELKKELTTPTYWLDLNGKLRVEEKDQIKKRLGFSPDKADALVLTFAIPEQKAEIFSRVPGQERGKLLYDYDPLGNPQT
jgi:hypothetical protein